MMYSPSTVHVLPFDPSYGGDTARQYAGKYASKPEKWYPCVKADQERVSVVVVRFEFRVFARYYLETERGGVKDSQHSVFFGSRKNRARALPEHTNTSTCGNAVELQNKHETSTPTTNTPHALRTF